MTPYKYVLIGVCVCAVLAWFFIPDHSPDPDKAYVQQTEQELVALANDTAGTAQRLAKIKAESEGWSDGRVGITADGYVFYYDLHESHGADNVSDIHILYLPDEKRFLIAHDHWCVDLSKWEQAKDKAEVVGRFE